MAVKRKWASVAGHISNAVVGALIGRLGLNLQGAELLQMRARKGGTCYSVPVKRGVVGGQRYLLAPRGETAWVTNIRVAGEGALRSGRRIEPTRVDEAPVIRILKA